MELDMNPKGLGWIAAENDIARVECDDSQGTFKVICKDKSFRGKTFKGELAWCNARHYVNDMISKTGRSYHDHLYW